MKIKKEYYTVEYNDTPEIHEMVFSTIIKFFIEAEAFDRETIMEYDEPSNEAPICLSEIAEIIKFKIT